LVFKITSTLMYLNCHSYFSLNYGTLSVEQLCDEALTRGISRLALTDINNTSAVFDFVQTCQQKGLQPVVGVEVRNSDQIMYLCLARNLEGFAEINRFLSHHALNNTLFPELAPAFEQVFVVYSLSRYKLDIPLAPHEWIGVRPSEVDRLRLLPRKALQLHRWVALQPVTFTGKQEYNLHRLLRSIHHNTLLSKLHVDKHASAEEQFPHPEQMKVWYEGFPQLLKNAQWLLNQCQFTFDFHTPKNKSVFTASPADDRMLLEKLAFDGLRNRYGAGHKEATQRAKRELDIIFELGFSAYFLITWDIIRYAGSRGYHHIGRGSGANSIVAYCVGITDVDPIELDLYFERFINPHRTSPPDFDIDFSWDERDEIQDYIFKRYGHDHVALIATYSTYRDKSIVRELGKVFGLPKQEIDALIDTPQKFEGTDIVRWVNTYGSLMENFPNYLSIHAGGVLISEKPIYYYSSLNPMPKGFPTTQFDMYVAEEIGFAKFDMLSQRGLGHIKDSVDIIRQNRQVSVDVHTIQHFKQDKNIRKQMACGETLGCFYIESPAMRQLIRKLNCDNYITLVAASSIIRPGVSKSGMMKAYIQRYHHPNDFEYIHPDMKPLLEETYGVMVYQEDVIKVAHHFAGLSLAEADVLRRAMSGKYRAKSEFLKIKDKFFSNCDAKGYASEISAEVWRQIESFSGYSFSKAHSASFAVESYQSLYLKTYYPQEFMVAVINNFGGFYRTEIYVHEARRYGAQVEAPCVNHSEHLTSIEGSTIYLGFVHMKNLESQVAKTIVLERNANGAFVGLRDFLARVSVGLEQLIILIKINALRFTGMSKKELLWDAHLLFHNNPKSVLPMSLFEEDETDFPLDFSKLSADQTIECAYDQIEILGFPLISPFDIVNWKSQIKQELFTRHLLPNINKQVVIFGYLICIKPVRTVKQENMAFTTFIDKEGAFFDAIHFPPELKRYPLKGTGVYKITGKVVEEFGCVSVEVKEFEKMPLMSDPRAVN